MKKLIIILIAASLYAPTIAKFWVYTACLVTVYTDVNTNTSWCNCSIETPQEKTKEDWLLQKQLVEKTNWQYTVTPLYHINYINYSFCKQFGLATNAFCKQGYMHSIFKPPVMA